MDNKFLMLREAATYLNVSEAKIWRLVKEGTLPVYSDPLDKRKRLVKREDVEKLKHPQKM